MPIDITKKMPQKAPGYNLGAHGIPVIASNASGLPEVVTHGKTSFLINPGDVNAIACYMSLLIEDEELRIKLGKMHVGMLRKDFI